MATWTQAQVQQWVDEQGGIEALELAVRQAQFGEGRMAAAKEYLQGVYDSRGAAVGAVDRALAERTTVATESQAETAKQALDRSNIAIIVSIVAALLAVVDLLTHMR